MILQWIQILTEFTMFTSNCFHHRDQFQECWLAQELFSWMPKCIIWEICAIWQRSFQSAPKLQDLVGAQRNWHGTFYYSKIIAYPLVPVESIHCICRTHSLNLNLHWSTPKKRATRKWETKIKLSTCLSAIQAIMRLIVKESVHWDRECIVPSEDLSIQNIQHRSPSLLGSYCQPGVQGNHITVSLSNPKGTATHNPVPHSKPSNQPKIYI